MKSVQTTNDGAEEETKRFRNIVEGIIAFKPAVSGNLRRDNPSQITVDRSETSESLESIRRCCSIQHW